MGKISMLGIKRSHALRVVAVAMSLVAWPSAAQAPQLAMLSSLEPGNWELRLRPSGETSQICVRNGREFIQLRHRQAGCDQFVVLDEADEVSVQYTCRGNGYGRTNIRREGPGLLQVSSRGTHGGQPFSIEGEARRIGRC